MLVAYNFINAIYIDESKVFSNVSYYFILFLLFL